MKFKLPIYIWLKMTFEIKSKTELSNFDCLFPITI